MNIKSSNLTIHNYKKIQQENTRKKTIKGNKKTRKAINNIYNKIHLKK
jgi:hypothetical protein